MTPQEAWKFAFNTFLSVTEGRIPLMSEIIHDHQPKLVLAATLVPALVTVSTETTAFLTLWDAAEQAVLNAEAAQLSATAAFEDKLASLTRKPDLDNNSPLETWDSTIRAQVAYQGTVYQLLLPHGRDTVTSGTYQQRIDAIEGLATRLAQQSAKPVLFSLSATVATFRTALNTLWNGQNTAANAHTLARNNIETLRVLGCRQMFRNVGMSMTVWNAEIDLPKIEGLFDMSLVRGATQPLPAAPIDTLWTPATRTLSTTALPADATRLEIWRQVAGGAPELLLVGGMGELSLVIPAPYTFGHGEAYQLWLQGRNGTGTSAPGPKQNWTAP